MGTKVSKVFKVFKVFKVANVSKVLLGEFADGGVSNLVNELACKAYLSRYCGQITQVVPTAFVEFGALNVQVAAFVFGGVTNHQS